MGVCSIKQNEDEYLVDYGKKRLIHPTFWLISVLLD